MIHTLRRSRKFCQRGSKNDSFFVVFLVDEGIEDPNTTVNGPSSARQWNTIHMAFPWWADEGPTLNAGLVALWFFSRSGPILLRNPKFLWFFSGGGSRPPVPPLDLSMSTKIPWTGSYVNYCNIYFDGYLGPDMNSLCTLSIYICIYFLTHKFYHMFWVLKRTVSLRWFFWVPTTFVLVEK